MKLNGFRVTVNGKGRDDGLVPMHHGERYKIGLHNSGSRRCDARVTVDGKEIGTFRLDGFGSAHIERPPNDTGCFTFYREGSSEAAASGISTGAVENGLISVTFMPERDYGIAVMDSLENIPTRGTFGGGMKGVSSGGTGLSGRSSQSFTNVSVLDYDRSGFTTIHVRLYCEDLVEEPRPLRSANETTVPGRVD